MLVEFAFVTPILILLVLAILGFGRAFYTYIDLTNAARAGARYATTQPDLYTCPTTTAFRNKVAATQPNISWSPVVTPAQSVTIDLDCAPLDNSVPPKVIPNSIRVTITYPFDTLIPKITSLPVIGTLNVFGVITLSTSATYPL